MIRPQTNAWRTATDLSGLWLIRFDPDGIGEAMGWQRGFDEEDALPIAVPGSWNEQLAESGYMNYVGAAWLQMKVFVAPFGDHETVTLRFGSADYIADVWVNGRHAGQSGAAMLPFEFDVRDHVVPGEEALVVVRVSNELSADGPTQGITKATYIEERRPRDEYLPAVRFDFFPYGGINRPVHLVRRPRSGIVSYRAISDTSGVRLRVVSTGAGSIVARLVGHGTIAEARSPLASGVAELMLHPDAPVPWSPAAPNLYELEIDLVDAKGSVYDRVCQRIGLREIRVDGQSLLLNGEPIQLRGFGKHEDSPLHGRGLNLPQLVKDFALMRWIGANSVRTSHYPYAEEFLDMADAAGILVIDEVFSINLDFRRVNDAVLANHKQAISELIQRDANRTCVIAWSLANEPGYLAEAEYRQRSGDYWRTLFAHARALDPTRPLTHANVGYAGNDDPAFGAADIIGLNRYYGWYSEPAQLDNARRALLADLDAVAVHGKPVMVLEFGADAMAGLHATHDQLFTEEYQSRFIEVYWDVVANHPAVVGGHVWNFADFRTAQHGRRVVHNLKGVFTRTREPKMAAWTLKRLWDGR
jgi:beta-glucuronidase